MKVIVLGAGMMGRAIAYDLCKHSNFDSIAIADKDKKTISSAEKFLKDIDLNSSKNTMWQSRQFHTNSIMI
ncbi:MAG: saccharopine dehydrogenase NADP-binding domain-containing protein [Euryarchaeota archaeon]|nr:saccharopine dehydrogenase NADP-binding domain-containing protein [Euryarchaeota archaeon]